MKFEENIHFEKLDLSDVKNIEKKLVKIVQKYGCPDIFVNAAYPRNNAWKNSNYEKLKLQDLEENVSIHLNSFIWSAIKIANIMKRNKKKGTIIMLNSIYGKVGQDDNLYTKTDININPVYSAMKGGLVSFIRNLSSYYGKYKIRANTIICGGIEGHVAGKARKQNKSFVKKYSSRTLLNRMGKPKDIASAVVFLSSDESSYITGSEIVVDGGYTAI